MKVELSIKDDSELRNLIKDMTRGQVKSLMRDDVADIAAKELLRKADRLTLSSWQLKDAVSKATKELGKEVAEMVAKELVEEMKESAEQRLLQKARALMTEDMDMMIRKAVGERIAELPVTVVVGQQDK